MLEIFWLKRTDSTQEEARRRLEKGAQAPFAVAAHRQDAGRGSRNNRWEGGEGNLYLSFVLPETLLPEDLPLSSASIYFGYLMKETLAGLDSKVWLKWPNDLYLDEEKVGGLITHKRGENLIVGIGINLVPGTIYTALDVKIPPQKIVNSYFFNLENLPKWKKIFSKFSVEFDKSRCATAHVNGERLPLREASLKDDGSLIIHGKRVFSLR